MRRLQIYAVIALASVVELQAAGPGVEQFLPLQDNRDAYTPAAASTKGVFTVIWQSGLLAGGALRDGPKYNSDIVGCRIDLQGRVLDSRPFVICAATDAQEMPRIAAATGGVFLAVWQDIRNGKDWDVYAARITADGKVLDSDGFPVSAGPHNQAKPRVAWDGVDFLVVWQDFRSGSRYDSYAARVSVDGKVRDPDGVLLETVSQCPVVASAGGGRSFVTFVSRKFPAGPKPATIPFGVFVADGKTAAPPCELKWLRDVGVLEPGPDADHNQLPLAMAAGTNTYLLSWKTFGPRGRGWQGAKRIPVMNNAAFDGVVLDSAGARVAGLQLKGRWDDLRMVDPDVVWDGTGYVVCWYESLSKTKAGGYDYDVTYAARVGPDGRVDGKVLEVSGDFEMPARQPCAASDGAGTSLIGYEKLPASGDVPVRIGYRLWTAGKSEK